MLIKYFHDKGLKESMDNKVYPPNLLDLPLRIPQLSSKIEIYPYVGDIDPLSGQVVLGWNLFVLGNQRMFLGESVHTNLSEIQVNTMGILNTTGINLINYTTPKKIISFIVETLRNNQEFDLMKCPKVLKPMIMPMAGMSTGDPAGYFRTSNRPVF
jgi:hypothetical protein